MTERRMVSPAQPTGSTRKILCLSDIHVPFHDQAVISHALLNHGDADEVVINGDMLDCHAISRFPKTQHIPFAVEFELARELLIDLSYRFRKIHLICGNHDSRIQKQGYARLDPAMLPLGTPDPLQLLADGFYIEDGNLLRGKKIRGVIYSGGPSNWYTQIGRAIFAHPSAYSKISMRTGTTACNYFKNKGFVFNCIVIGHTHQMGKVYQNGTLIIEQGCCCLPSDYESTPRLAYSSPTSSGYCVVVIGRNGAVDYNNTGPIYCGSFTGM